MAEGMAERMVHCVKLGRELPGFEKPPFSGELGQRIFESISKEAWQLWQAQSVMVMNHYGLQLIDPEARRFLMKVMEDFLFGEGSPLPAQPAPPGSDEKPG